jgi:hypothetical protein
MLTGAVRMPELASVVADFAGVRLIDAAGLGALVNAGGGLRPITGWWIPHELGISGQLIRFDRMLEEAIATGGDIRHQQRPPHPRPRTSAQRTIRCRQPVLDNNSTACTVSLWA